MSTPRFPEYADWLRYAHSALGDECEDLRQALRLRDVDTVVSILAAHGVLEDLLPLLPELELLERLHSPQEGRLLTLEEFMEEYGITQADLDAVVLEDHLVPPRTRVCAGRFSRSRRGCASH